MLIIKDIREDRNLTQEEICKYLKCDQSLYSKYERETREIPLRHMIALADYYHVSVDYLAGRTKNPHMNK